MEGIFLNISNGALISKHNNNLFVCDLEKYRGTYIVSEDGSIIDIINDVMWFIAQHDNHIYYSNQKDNDYLYCLDIKTLTESCILNIPCSYITVFEDKILFLDETDSQVYEFDTKKEKAVPLIKEKIFSFVRGAEVLYCAFAKGLLEFDLRSKKSNVLTNHIPMCLNYTATGLIFADSSYDFALSRLDFGKKEPQIIGNIKTQSLVANEHQIYAANLQDNHSIVRMDASGGAPIRFCGEKADKLHIIENELYFQNHNDKNAWYKMPLSGGRNTRLLSASV